MSKKNNLCQQYIKRIKSLFPIMGKEEKKYIKQLSGEIADFLDNEKLHNLDELYKEFGHPNDVVNNYFRLYDTDKIIKRIRIGKWIKCGIVIILFTALITSLIWGYTTYRDYKIFSEEQVFYEDLTIN